MAWTRALSACLFAAAIMMAAPAMADEQKGMPQLDFANPLTVSQILWLVVIFVVLYLLLSAWALPRVGSVIGERATRVATDLDSARAAKAEADAAAAEAQEGSTRAHAEAQARVNAAVEAAKREAAGKSAERNAALEKRLASAEQRIEAARGEAMASLRQVAAAAATGMIERLTGGSADALAVEAAVGQLAGQRTA